MIRLLLVMLVSSICVLDAWANSPPKVSVTIKPVHALVAGVMRGIGEPKLLMSGANSPHGYQLKPSERQLLNDSDIVFWVGKQLEFFIVRLMADLSANTRLVSLIDIDDLALPAHRPPGVITGDALGATALDDAAQWATHRSSDAMSSADPHIWLSPNNAQRIVAEIARVLSQVDPANQVQYAENAAQLTSDIAALDNTLAARLKALHGLKFVVFHDAYQHFEHHFGVTPVAVVSVHADRPPGAKRIAEIRQEIISNEIDCVFSEPQFPPKLVATLIAGTQAIAGNLDPIGADLAPGADAWFSLLTQLVDDLSDCHERRKQQ